MPAITIKPTTKKSGSYFLRFRVRDGRNIDLYYCSKIKADVEAMRAFDKYGNCIALFGRFDRDLRDSIESTLFAIDRAYEEINRRGLPCTSEMLTMLIDGGKDAGSRTFLDDLADYIDRRESEGFITHDYAKHLRMYARQLSRYLSMSNRQNITTGEFLPDDVRGFHDFLRDEYLYIKKHPRIYIGCGEGRLPHKPRKENTIAGTLKRVGCFFSDMYKTGKIPSNPFDRLGRDIEKSITHEVSNTPVYLRAEELQTIINTDVPERLQQCKDIFILQCTLGCRISDFVGINRSRIDVSPDGIPFYRYVPRKTSRTIHEDVETPLMYNSLEILKKYNFVLPLLRNISGKDGYNKQISQLLEYCGIDRPCKVWNEEKRQNDYVPLYTFGSTKICRKTHEDMMVKVQINLYTTGLHRVGSGAIKAYTHMEIVDRFRLMCIAFGQPEYRTDENLNVIS